MKTITKIFILLAIALFVSCSTDTENEPITATTTQQFAKVGMNFNPESQNTTGKTVNRGSVYAWINSIKVKATNGTYSKETIFDLVNSGAETNDFILDNVLVGSNTFDVTTTTKSIPKIELSTFPTTISPTDKLSELNSLNPYAVYSGTLTADIALTNNNLSPINLTTQNGRVINIFVLSDDLRNNGYYAKIKSNPLDPTQYIADKNNNVALYWSSDFNGYNEVKVDIVLYDRNNVQLPNTQQIVTKIIASSSNNIIYTISDSSLHYNSVSTTAKFSVQTWNTSNSNIDTSISLMKSFNVSFKYYDLISLTNENDNLINLAQITNVGYMTNYSYLGFECSKQPSYYYNGIIDLGNNTLKSMTGHIITVTPTSVTDYNPIDNVKIVYHN